MTEEKNDVKISEKEKTNVEEFVSKYNITETIENALNDAFTQNANPYEFLSNYFSKKITSSKSNEGNNSIDKLVGREILDSRGNPTVECDVYVNGKRVGRASAPSGASTGSNEAHELRDDDKSRYLGKGVLIAVKNVSGPLSESVVGKNIDKLSECDEELIKKDGTELKKTFGGNAITACSFALAVGGANLAKEELFQYLTRQFSNLFSTDPIKKFSIPTPLVNILNGGKHAGGDLKIQEFMIVPFGDKSFKEALRKVTTVYHHLGSILSKKIGKSAKNLGDEGGFAPNLSSPDEALGYIEEAIQSAGYKVGEDVKLAMDCAASEFYDSETKKYEIIKGKYLTSDELVSFYEDLIKNHPGLCSIEDGFDEKDYDGWKEFTKRLQDKVMIVGDDLYTTNTNLIKKGIEDKWATALLLKVNQIGTITESMRAAKLIFNAKQNVIVSHRSGETESTLISDLAVAIGAKFIKTGAPARGERVAKYNRLLQIEEFLSENDLLETSE